MNQNDKQHIDAICLRHGIKILSKLEAMIVLLRSGRRISGINTGEACSFSHQCTDRDTGEAVFRGIYLSPDDYKDDNITLGLTLDPEEHGYFVALHELGHCILGHHNTNPDLKTLEIEAQHEIEAWEWAFTHSQYWPSDGMCVAALNACNTYTHLEDAIARGEISANLGPLKGSLS